MALRVGMPEVRVHELLGAPIAGNKTSTPRRPHRWYYAVPACFERVGWTVEVQILDEKLFGAWAAEGGHEAFRCSSEDCPRVVDAGIFAHLPARQDSPAKRPTTREPDGITAPQNNALQLTRPAQAMEPRS